jgi:hypothetical protein
MGSRVERDRGCGIRLTRMGFGGEFWCSRKFKIHNRGLELLSANNIRDEKRSETIDRRPNHFHFHIFLLENEIDTILSETNMTPIFR